MRKIQILGVGCHRCIQLAANAEEAAKTLGIDYEIEKITDITKIVDYGIMATPGLVIDGKVKSSGKLVSVDDIIEILESVD